jgi:hypothetical protein
LRKESKTMDVEGEEYLPFALHAVPPPPVSTAAFARLSDPLLVRRDSTPSELAAGVRVISARGRGDVLHNAPPPPKIKTRSDVDVEGFCEDVEGERFLS